METRRLAPSLRFPEFKDAPAWDESTLGKISPSVFDGTHQTPTYTEKGVPFFSVENLVSGVTNKFISHADYLSATNRNKPQKGDVLITRIGKIGFSQVVTWESEFSVYVTLAVVKQAPAFDSQYLHCFIQSAYYQSEILSNSLLNAVPCKINMDSLRATEVLLPGLAEQKKIADCLKSLDELITGQARKVEALRKFNHDLTQNLFPRDGEATPRFRLAKFSTAPNWKPTTLGDLAVFQSGGTPSKANPSYWRGSTPWVSAKDMKHLFLEDTEDHISAVAVEQGARVAPRGTPLILTRGMTLLKDVPICVLRRGMAFNQDVKALKPKAGVDGAFLAFLLIGSKQRLLKMVDVAGHGTGKLNTDELTGLELVSPQLDEQLHIADCLISLDTIISQEAKKLNTLKKHKQGLMQGLFPSPETPEQ